MQISSEIFQQRGKGGQEEGKKASNCKSLISGNILLQEDKCALWSGGVEALLQLYAAGAAQMAQHNYRSNKSPLSSASEKNMHAECVNTDL